MDSHIKLYSIAFQLLNTVEVNGAVQGRRTKEDKSLSSINGLWTYHLEKLKEKGFTKNEKSFLDVEGSEENEIAYFYGHCTAVAWFDEKDNEWIWSS